ncbi:peptide-methionine (S)-S-oxide reductase MsrA [Estrella lausannensis]|uniref:Peptide methionine sulfoxide reductase MsrA n=1 Tax=Estrella lausannensis TaxID=483423 RepID=A0A0H5DRI8_9BACT|nr:peptide-methionine (S)-S-oxide reductase MsrA [Estrella lausannensis]CRX38309.1 peptide-methionine sulfoxide reductase [Estrella lausannensis]
MRASSIKKATFAGGCFWCMEPPFEGVEGVVGFQVGYTGGAVANPRYEEVSTGKTGHLEAIQIVFDEAVVSFDRLLRIFFFNIDPLDPEGQFVDKGSQYQTAVFYHSEEQKKVAQQVIKELMETRRFSRIETKLIPYVSFYPAEEWHQRFHRKNNAHYERYKRGSGREERLKDIWGPKEGCEPCG